MPEVGRREHAVSNQDLPCEYDGEIYCIGCLPDGVNANNSEVTVFDSFKEWDELPECSACGEIFTEVRLSEKGRELMRTIVDELNAETTAERRQEHEQAIRDARNNWRTRHE